MNALRSLIVLFFALLAIAHCYIIDVADDGDEMAAEYMPKRSYQHIWRNVQMQMPSMQGNKRSESMSRARANAYYRLG